MFESTIELESFGSTQIGILKFGTWMVRRLNWALITSNLRHRRPHVQSHNDLTINEWGWVSYEELWRSRKILYMIQKPNLWFQKLSPPPHHHHHHLAGNSSQASCSYLNFWAFENPPPPRNFQSLLWRKYGYFLELNNSIIVLLFIPSNCQFKNIAKTCLPPSMLSSSSIVRI